MDSGNLISIGRELGLEDAELRAWLEEERVRLRAERTEERNAIKEEMAMKLQLVEQEREAAREKAAQQQKLLEQEQKILELKLRLQENAASQQAAHNPAASSTSASAASNVCSPHKLIPPFNDERDDLDAYLQRFERVAICQEWPREKWALSLSLCMTGEALTVIGRMDPSAAVDYDTLKRALLQRFLYTAEGYRDKFRGARPENRETAKQFSSRLAGYFDHWLELSQTERSFSGLRELIIAEQFVKSCSPALRVFLKERNCRTLHELAQTADNFVEAQSLMNLSKERPENEDRTGCGLRTELTRKTSRLDNRCYLCDKKGHRAAECWSRTRRNSTANGSYGEELYSNGAKNPSGEVNSREALCLISEDRAGAEAAHDSGYVMLGDGEKVPVISTTVSPGIRPGTSDNLPLVQGLLNKCPVTVLRDTGCDTVIVRQALVPREKLTGTYRPVLLMDRTLRYLPEATVFLDTPFFVGEVRAQCMRDPLYDVVLGNIKGVVPLDTLEAKSNASNAKNCRIKRASTESWTPNCKGRQSKPVFTGVEMRSTSSRPSPQPEAWLSRDTPTIRLESHQPQDVLSPPSSYRGARPPVQSGQRKTVRRCRSSQMCAPDYIVMDNSGTQMRQALPPPQPPPPQGQTRCQTKETGQGCGLQLGTSRNYDYLEGGASSAFSNGA